MKRVMFSQPMANKTYAEICDTKYDTAEKLADKIKKTLRVEAFAIMNTTVPNHEEKTDIECFAESIGYLAKADLLVMCNGWENARGCKLEHDIAEAYGVPIMYE